VRDDDAWNGGSIVRPNENGRRASRTSTIIDGDAKEANANRMVCMVSSVKEADVCVGERTICEQEMTVVGRTSHRAVVGVHKREVACLVVCFCQAAKEDGVRRGVEVDRF
jgi:hypothetical protein